MNLSQDVPVCTRVNVCSLAAPGQDLLCVDVQEQLVAAGGQGEVRMNALDACVNIKPILLCPRLGAQHHRGAPILVPALRKLAPEMACA